MKKLSEESAAVPVEEKLPSFYAPILTVFQAETGVRLPDGKSDTEDGEFSWWCARNVWVLERRGLYMVHPVATVLKAYADGEPPRCTLVQAPPPDHARVYFPDTESSAAWQVFLAAGGAAGASFAAWKALQAPKPPFARRNAS